MIGNLWQMYKQIDGPVNELSKGAVNPFNETRNADVSY